MPIVLPLLIALGGVGAGNLLRAGLDANKANEINKSSEEMLKQATEALEIRRLYTKELLDEYGNLKVSILSDSMMDFLESFRKIKNVNFKDVEKLNDFDLNVEQTDFDEITELSNVALGLAAGVIAGGAGGALTAFSAYGAAGMFAKASTGTAIATLKGVAAHNATLAFFGGGSIAAGGGGMAAGAAVLGGIVIAPALVAAGLIAGNEAKKALEKANIHAEQCNQYIIQLTQATNQCEKIIQRLRVYYELLCRMDVVFTPLVLRMSEIIALEGEDYSLYTDSSKKIISSCASTAITIKKIMDVAIIDENGNVTKDSKEKYIAFQTTID